MLSLLQGACFGAAEPKCELGQVVGVSDMGQGSRIRNVTGHCMFVVRFIVERNRRVHAQIKACSQESHHVPFVL